MGSRGIWTNLSSHSKKYLHTQCTAGIYREDYYLLIMLLLCLFFFAEIPTLKENLAKCVSVDKPWAGWSDNYALLIVDVLSLSNDIAHYTTQAT